MARLPRFQRNVQVPGSAGGDRVSPNFNVASGLAAFGQGLGAMGAELERINAGRESAWVTRASAEGEMFSAELETRLEGEADEGAPNHVQSYRKEWAKYRDGVLKAAPSSRARSALEARFLNTETGGVKRRASFQSRAQLSKREEDFRLGIRTRIDAAGANPERLEEELQIISDDVIGNASWLAGDDPGVTEVLVMDAQARAMEAAAMTLAQRGDLDGASELVDRIRATGDDGRAMEVEFAINEIEAEQTKVDNGEEFNREYSAAIDEGLALVGSGEITEDWISQNSETLSDADMRDFKTSMTARPQPDNVVRTELSARALDPGTNREALSMLASGLITRDDFNGIMAALALSPAAQRERSRIVAELAPPDMVASELFLESVGEFDNFAGQQPDLSQEQLRERADIIIRDGRKKEVSAGRASLPLPHSMPNSRGAITLEGVKKAIADTVRAFENGQMAPEEAAAEGKRLRAWFELLENEARANGN